MKDRLRGSAEGTTNAFTTGHCEKGNYSLVLIERAMIISVQDTKCCFQQGNYCYKCQMVKNRDLSPYMIIFFLPSQCICSLLKVRKWVLKQLSWPSHLISVFQTD